MHALLALVSSDSHKTRQINVDIAACEINSPNAAAAAAGLEQRTPA